MKKCRSIAHARLAPPVCLSLISLVCLLAGWQGHALAWEVGQEVMVPCKSNPFNPSQKTKAKVYAEASLYGQVVTELCQEPVKVLSVEKDWAKVEAIDQRFKGYMHLRDLPEKEASPAQAAPAQAQPPASPPSVPQGERTDTAETARPGGQPAPALQPQPAETKEAQPPSGVASPPLLKEPPAAEERTPEKILLEPAPPSAAQPAEKQLAQPAVKAKPKKARQKGKDCGKLFIKMSKGELLTKSEQEYLREQCN
ncbi:hypothetical protein AAU61_10525 [Desulfocarbo indianensis]|nr:hypothetical protein AAU61_10525 [Desulfocarbo indianensis]